MFVNCVKCSASTKPAMIVPSVLFILSTISLQLADSRRLSDDMDNDINSPMSYVKIVDPPAPIIRKKVGDHVELTCEASGSPPPVIQWYRRNQRLTENESYDTNVITQSTGIATVSSRLVINYILPRHQDIYTCLAEGPTDSKSRTTKLIVTNKTGKEMNFTQLISAKILGAHHLPRVTFWASTFLDVIGNDIVLPCKSVGNPKPNQIWINPHGKVIEHDEKYSILPEGGLRIRNIEWSDMGEYICSVENSVGVDSVETFLYPMKESSK